MRRQRWLEVGIGSALAAVVFLYLQGINLLPFVALAAVAYLFVRSMPLPGLPRRFAVVSPAEAGPPAVTFDDVGGQESAKKEMLEALDFLKQEDRVRRLGIRPLKGILLTGPPGTGKTLLAKAAANYTNSIFIAASGSEFIEMYAGVGAQRVRELFRRAREEARAAGQNAVIFIDEIEVIAGRRGRHQSHLEYDQTLNQLLVEMDGISIDDDVRMLVIAATNRADLIDDALLRPGRFDRIVKVDLPDREGRRRILELHTRNKPIADDVDLDEIARETFNFSGAHLESLANEAAIWAMRRGLDKIPHAAFLEAIDKVIMGEKLDRRPEPEERRRIAVHEAGHALVGEWLLPGSVARVTITSRGQALGYVRSAPKADQYLYTKEELERDICVCLAGSAAEQVVFGNRSTGAGNDFEQAVRLAHVMISSGMSRLGIVDPERLPRALEHEVVAEILSSLEEKVVARLAEWKPVLEDVAAALLENESMSGHELRERLAAATSGTDGAAPEAAAAVEPPA